MNERVRLARKAAQGILTALASCDGEEGQIDILSRSLQIVSEGIEKSHLKHEDELLNEIAEAAGYTGKQDAQALVEHIQRLAAK